MPVVQRIHPQDPADSGAAQAMVRDVRLCVFGPFDAYARGRLSAAAGRRRLGIERVVVAAEGKAPNFADGVLK